MTTITHTLNLTCTKCGKKVTVTITSDELSKYRQGELIQRAFPNLNPEQREMILTGTCSECWNELFPPEDDSPTQPFN